MEESVTIRPGTEADIPHLLRIQISAMSLFSTAPPPHAWLAGAQRTMHPDDLLFSAESDNLWVATPNETRIVGFISAKSINEPKDRYLFIDAVFVDRAYQRRGIGTRFLRHVETQALQQGDIDFLSLSTFRGDIIPWNEPFYQRYRFHRNSQGGADGGEDRVDADFVTLSREALLVESLEDEFDVKLPGHFIELGQHAAQSLLGFRPGDGYLCLMRKRLRC